MTRGHTETDIPAVAPLDSPAAGPVDLFDALRRELRYPFLLDSADGPPHIARYTLLGGNPFLVFTCHKGIFKIEYSDGATVTGEGDPLLVLDDLIKKFAPAAAGRRPAPRVRPAP